MSVVSVIDTLTAWTQDNICSQIRLKVPPKAGDPNDADMDYETVHPTAFPMFIPTADKLPPDTYQFPSVCIRFQDGEDNAPNRGGSIEIQMLFAAWDPGLHGQDIFHKLEECGFCRQSAIYTEFQRSASGWRDCWNFVDIALRKIESTSKIGAIGIDRSSVRFGPVVEQDSIPDFYPFWFAQVTFTVTYPLLRFCPDDEPAESAAPGESIDIFL